MKCIQECELSKISDFSIATVSHQDVSRDSKEIQKKSVLIFIPKERISLTTKSISLYLFAIKPRASKPCSDSTNENHKLHGLQLHDLANRLEEGLCKQQGFFFIRLKVEKVVEGSPKQLLKDEMTSESHRHLDRRCSQHNTKQFPIVTGVWKERAADRPPWV